MARYINPFNQYFDKNGQPLSFGKVFFYDSGSNTTFRDTFSDPNLNNKNTNPIILDGEGRTGPIWLDGVYNVIVQDRNGVQIEQDDPVGGEVGSRDAFSDWTSGIIYNITSIVVGPDGKYYQTLIDNNLGNDPSTSPAAWEEIRFIGIWNTNIDYEVGEIVQTTDGLMWRGMISPNIGNNPSTDDGTNWQPVVDSQKLLNTWDVAVNYSAGDNVRTTDGNLWRAVQANIGNDPLTDDGTNWLKAVIDNNSAVFTGGGTLTQEFVNEIQDGSTYDLPSAASVPANRYLIISLPDEFKTFEPTVQVDGSDTISYSGGTDTDILFDSGTSKEIRLTSDGVSDWRLTI